MLSTKCVPCLTGGVGGDDGPLVEHHAAREEAEQDRLDHQEHHQHIARGYTKQSDRQTHTYKQGSRFRVSCLWCDDLGRRVTANPSGDCAEVVMVCVLSYRRRIRPWC